MEITVSLQRASEPVAVIRLQGSIDASNFVQIVDKAQEIYQNPARKRVKLLSPQPAVEKALDNAGMKLFFKVFQDLESALTSF